MWQKTCTLQFGQENSSPSQAKRASLCVGDHMLSTREHHSLRKLRKSNPRLGDTSSSTYVRSVYVRIYKMFISLIRQKALYVNTLRRMPPKKATYIRTRKYVHCLHLWTLRKPKPKVLRKAFGAHYRATRVYIRTYVFILKSPTYVRKPLSYIRRYSELIQSCRCDAFHKNGSLRVFTHVRTYMRNVTQLRTTYSKPESTYNIPSLRRLHLRTSYRKGRNGAKQGR